jgi:hypothetical protein
MRCKRLKKNYFIVGTFILISMDILTYIVKRIFEINLDIWDNIIFVLIVTWSLIGIYIVFGKKGRQIK